MIYIYILSWITIFILHLDCFPPKRIDIHVDRILFWKDGDLRYWCSGFVSWRDATHLMMFFVSGFRRVVSQRKLSWEKSANLIKMCAKSTWKKVSAERLESSIDLVSHREILFKKNDICSFHGIRRKVDLYIHSTTFNITNLESMDFMVPEIGVIGTIYKPAQGKMCEYRNIYIYLYKCIYIDTCYISGIHCPHRVMLCYLHTC